MRCPSCNAELVDYAKFCTHCGQRLGDEPQQAQPEPQPQVAGQAQPEPQPQVAGQAQVQQQSQQAQPDFQQQTQAPQQQMYGQAAQQPAYGQTGQQPAYGQTGQQPAYGQTGQQPAYGQAAYGTPNAAGQAAFQNQAAAVGSATPTPPPAKKRSKMPAVLAVIAVLVIAAVGTCLAFGVIWPFGGLAPLGNPMEQLERTMSNIEGSGNIAGTYDINLDMDMSSIDSGSSSSGNVSYSIGADYTMRNFNRNDYSNLVMDMTMKISGSGAGLSSTYNTTADMHYENGKATVTTQGETQTVDLDMEDVMAQTGAGMADLNQLREYLKEARIEGNTVHLKLDKAYFDKAFKESLGNNGLSGASVSSDDLEMSFTVGSDEVTVDANFALKISSMGYSVPVNMQVKFTEKKL